MAKQGNYVTLPGVDPNWAKGISSALSDLSRSYNAKAAQEEEAARMAAAAEEDKRRFGLEQAYKEQEALRTADYRKQQLANEAEQARLTAENRAAQLSIQERAQQIADDAAALEKAQREGLVGISEAYSRGDFNKPVTLDQYGNEAREFWKAKLGSYDTGEVAARNYLLTPSAESLTAAKEAYAKTLADSDLSPAAQTNKVNAYGKGLEQQLNLLKTDNLAPLTREGRIDQLVSGLYDPARQNTLDEIASGRTMLLDSKARAVYSGLDPKIRESVTYPEFLKEYESKLPNLSRAALEAKETDRIAAAQDANEARWDRTVEALRYIENNGLSRSGVSKNSTAENMIDAIKTTAAGSGLSADEIGYLDNKDAKVFIADMIKENRNPDAIAAVAMLGVSGMWDKDFPEKGTEAYADLSAQVAQLDQNSRSGSGRKLFTSEEILKRMEPAGVSRRSLLQQQLGQSRMRGDDLTTRLPSIPAAPAPTVPQRGVLPTNTPIQDRIANLSTAELLNTRIAPRPVAPVQQARPSVSVELPDNTPGKGLISPEIQSQLDTSYPQITLDENLRPVPAAAATPKQEISRDILATAAGIQEADRVISKWGFDINNIPANAPAIVRNAAESKLLLEQQLRELEARLK